MTEQQFEQLKNDFFEKADVFSNVLREISLEDFTSNDGFTQLATLRMEAAASYSLLIIERKEMTYKAENGRLRNFS